MSDPPQFQLDKRWLTECRVGRVGAEFRREAVAPRAISKFHHGHIKSGADDCQLLCRIVVAACLAESRPKVRRYDARGESL